MHILLLILKMIGIVLLVILGLILVLLFCILFVPVRYQIRGEYRDKQFNADAIITYLFPLLSVVFGYREEAYAKLKIFGLVFKDFLHPKSKRNKKKKTKIKQLKNHKQSDDLNSDDLNLNVINLDDEIKTSEELIDASSEENLEQSLEAVSENISDEPNQESTFIEKIKKVYTKIVSIFHKILYFLEHIDKKVDTLLNKIDEFQNKICWFIEFAQRNDTITAFQTAKKSIVRLLRGIRPRKSKVYLHCGMDDPATTGQICAFYGMLYPFIEKCVMIEPDFEQTILEGNFYFKGYINGFMFIRVLCTLLFSRDLKCIRKLYKSKKNSHKN